MSNKTQELIEILKANSERELIFLYPEEGSGHPYTLGHPSNILLDEYVILDDRVWLRFDDEDELIDHVSENIAESNFKEFPLTEEQEEWVDRYAKAHIENLNWKKAIVVYIYP